MKSFQCKDVGYQCDWKVTGDTEDEILSRAQEHGREKHGLTKFDDDVKKKIRSHIHDVKAA